MKKFLNRRTFLRGMLGGAAVAVALPRLDAMLDANATAYADGSSLPMRFGVFFWGNGVTRAQWVPSQSGVDNAWPLSDALLPLAGVRHHMSVISGMQINGGGDGHLVGFSGILSGAPYIAYPQGPNESPSGTYSAPTIDQVVARHPLYDRKTPYRSLELGVSTSVFKKVGSWQHLSHNGPEDPNPAEYSPTNLFHRLFGASPDPLLNGARASVLDVVMEDARSLQSTLGSHDRARLEQHLDNIRAIEIRLRTAPPLCATPLAPAVTVDSPSHEDLEGRSQRMSELLAVALACDLTRVFTFAFTLPGSQTVFWQEGVGATEGLHAIAHGTNDPLGMINKATKFTMKQFAYLLEKLDIGEGDANVLRNSCILGTTEFSDPPNHNNLELPIIVAGQAQGKLRTGMHHRVEGTNAQRNAVRVLLTVLRAAGLPLSEFGVDKSEGSPLAICRTTEELNEIMS